MKRVKVTIKEIQRAMRAGELTNLYKYAHLRGIDTSDKNSLCTFFKKYAPSTKTFEIAHMWAWHPHWPKDKKRHELYRKMRAPKKMMVRDAVKWAKYQRKECKGTNYFKVLIKGNTHYYWAHPFYKDSDYNKSRAFPIDGHKRLAELINSYLLK